MAKVCIKCNQIKALALFDKRKSNKDGRREYCKDCRNSARRAAYNKNPDTFRNNFIQHKYGLTAIEYTELLKQQKYSCAICAQPQSNLSQRLSIDHSHETGAVRGLLCNCCNRGIGLLKDNTITLANAIKYLNATISKVG